MSINTVLTNTQITACLDAIAQKESTSTPGGPANFTIGRSRDKDVIKAGHQNYGVINGSGYVGKYQLGYLGLADTGWVKLGPTSNKALLDNSNWLGKMGCKSLEDFLKNAEAQEKAARELFATNYRYLRSSISDCAAPDIAGYCCAAHLVGWSDAKKLRQGINRCDANGCDAMYYFRLGVAAINGESINIVAPPAGRNPSSGDKPESSVGGARADGGLQGDPKKDPRILANERQDSVKVPPEVAQRYANTGFIDPNLVYPKSSYHRFPDTNKLAIHLDVSNTLVKKKNENRHTSIPTANHDAWEEPVSPYNARYPYNKVTETESGHVQEFDDTPGSERIHTYHRSGTYQETNQDGSTVRRIVGDSYEIIDRNGNIFINGRCNLTVGGACNILVLADANINVKGDTNIVSENDVNWEVSGNFNLQVNETFNVRTKNLNVEVDEDQNVFVGQSSTEQVVGLVAQQYDAGVQTKVTGDSITVISGDASTNVGGQIDLKSDGDYNHDSAKIMLNSGAASPKDVDYDPVVHTNMRNAVGRCAYLDNSSPNVPYRTRTDEIAQHICEFDHDHAVPAGESRASRALVEDSVTTGSGGNVVTTDYNSQMDIDPETFLTMTDFPKTLKISRFYTLGDLLCGNTLHDQCGLSKGQIVYNLSVLAQTVLDPVRYAQSSVMVNSGFRIGEAKSQHNRGQAADLRFVGVKLAEYQKIAEWIRDNTKYDQIILESKKDDPRSLWIHVSVRTKFGGASAPGTKTAYNGGSSATPTVIAANTLDIGKLPWLDLTTYKSA